MNGWQFSDSSAKRHHRIALAEDKLVFAKDDYQVTKPKIKGSQPSAAPTPISVGAAEGCDLLILFPCQTLGHFLQHAGLFMN
ncbi:hypothetical protein [Pseudomonas thivervalensis]|uniref:hypothetical protein n=1 Tax=Pseudomonas thivervalensis TaxID=86265 RepID=UPI001290542D|nr:hypothetical protein [Pseudomonas thivervalensis]